MKTIEMLIRKGDTRLVVGITTGRKVQFTAKMQYGDRPSALTAYGNSVDAAISNLEDGLMNEIAEDEHAATRFTRTSNNAGVGSAPVAGADTHHKLVGGKMEDEQ